MEETFEFTYTFRELAERQVTCPVTLFEAAGDDYSFLENTRAGRRARRRWWSWTRTTTAFCGSRI
ncbi:hypothetical protein [Streptomyces flavochromogenes]|uniref:hypothetical protein n=1 Tax=Streptomyces flavochromogenes TaxID=68199 RepID=UPI001FD8313D